MDDHTERTQAVGALVAAYPGVEVTELTIRTYVWSTSDLPLELLTVAMQQCRDKAKFFPSIAEIREQAEAIKKEYKDDTTNKDCVLCYGLGRRIEKVDGYNTAVPCDHIAKEPEVDPNNMDMF